MNAIISKTLLYVIISFTLLLSSCSSVNYKTSRDYTKNRTTKSHKSVNKRNNSTKRNKSRSNTHKKTSSSSSKYAEKSRTNSINSERYSIINTADNFQGIPYRYGGKTTSGFDCSGFVCYVFKKNNLSVNGSSKSQAKLGKKIPISKAKPGDLLFFGSNNNISHVSIIAENSRNKLVVIHATSSRGVVKENIKGSSYWTPRILFARDVISSTDFAD